MFDKTHINEIHPLIKWIFRSLGGLIFIISSCLSSLGAYDQYSESNITLAWVLVGIFIGLGIVFSIAMSYFHHVLKHIKSTLISLLVGGILLLWLGTSPFFNLAAVAMPKAVAAEIAERNISIERKITPMLINFKLVESNISGTLESIITNIDKEIDHQTNLGGCKNICNFYKDLRNEVDHTESILANQFNEERLLMLEESRETLINLPLQSDLKWQEQLYIFNNSILSLQDEIGMNKSLENPQDILNRTEQQINLIKISLEGMQIYSDSPILKMALSSAKDRVSHIIKSISEAKQSLKIQPVGENKSLFNPIQASSELLIKHWRNFIELFFLAFFLDSLAIILFVTNVTVFRKVNT